MKLDPSTKTQIIKNASLSLFLYILPIALMFGTFAITGQRPWEKKHQHKQETTVKTKTTNSPDNEN